MTYYIAINQYRNSTGDGFGNTWEIRTCASRKHQIEVLTKGLPVSDQCWEDSDGIRHPSYSTFGIRLATPKEIRELKRNLRYGEQPRVLIPPEATIDDSYTY